MRPNIPRPIRLLAILLALWLAAACQRPSEPQSEAGGAPGVSDDEIRVGSSLPLTGHASYLGAQTLRGALSCLNHVNETGGVHGRRIKVVAMDDGYDPPRCLVNTQKLLIEENVFSLFCYVGTPTTLKIIPLVNKARIPLAGMFTGANALREPFNRYLVNIRPSYYQETGAAVKRLVEELGLRRIAVFYQYDSYGFDGLTGAELALKDRGLTPVARGNYVRGTSEVEDGLQRIRDSKAEAVIMIGAYDPCAKFINLAKSRGYKPIFYMVSFVGGDELARRLDEKDDPGVLMSQAAPPPEDPESRRLMWCTDEYVELLARYFPDERPNVVGLEAFLNAKVLVEGLERAGPDLTREGFLNAIETIRDMPIGDDTVLSFSPADHQGLDRVYFTRLDDGHFRLFTDWSEVRRPGVGASAGQAAP